MSFLLHEVGATNTSGNPSRVDGWTPSKSVIFLYKHYMVGWFRVPSYTWVIHQSFYEDPWILFMGPQNLRLILGQSVVRGLPSATIWASSLSPRRPDTWSSQPSKHLNQRSMLLNAWGLLLSAWALSIHVGRWALHPDPLRQVLAPAWVHKYLQSPRSKIIDLAACILTQKKYQLTTKLGKDSVIVMLRIHQELSNPDSLLNERQVTVVLIAVGHWTVLFPNKSGSRMTMGCLGSLMVRGTTKHVIWAMVEIRKHSPLLGDGCKPTNNPICERATRNNYDQPSTNQDSAISM